MQVPLDVSHSPQIKGIYPDILVNLISFSLESFPTKSLLGIRGAEEDHAQAARTTHSQRLCPTFQTTSGDGGWVHARDAKHHDRLKSLINHGFDPAYHFLHFETAPNAKMNGLGAAFVCAQVKSLPEVIKHRESLARWYRASLQTLEEISCMEKAEHDAPWVFGVEVKDRQTRDQLRDYLAENGIETRNYFFPLHLEPVNYYSGDAGVYDIVLERAERAAQAQCL